jgi:FKBP-type peptidyl-prolyl cis-trans isomerase (trigger factor)
MQVSLETTSGLERRLTIGVPAEQVEAEVENRLKQAARTVTIKGFRNSSVLALVYVKKWLAMLSAALSTLQYKKKMLSQLVSQLFKQSNWLLVKILNM